MGGQNGVCEWRHIHQGGECRRRVEYAKGGERRTRIAQLPLPLPLPLPRKMAALREAVRRQQAASEATVSTMPATGEQPTQQACACAELGQAELHGAADDGPDEVEGELAELGGAEAALWQQVDALNSRAASGCAAANGSGDASHGALSLKKKILGQCNGHVERRAYQRLSPSSIPKINETTGTN